MNSHNVTDMPKTPLVINTIAVVDQEKNPSITTYKQWLIDNAARLPPPWSEDHHFIATECYQRFIQLHQHDFNCHKHAIDLIENKSQTYQHIESVWVTLQTSDFAGKLSLVLGDDYNEVTLASLKDIHLMEPIVPAYHERKIELFTAFTPELTHVCLKPGQEIYLRVIGGLLITDNILIHSTVLA
ncbi:MAG: hypothetical protein COB35_13075 [Gammaproteobacteria bacterium]|nr:MAG: hypothetical protein COB35_13075 [Gammaproteobacteria bacterium]